METDSNGRFSIGSELQNWALQFSLPFLQNILPLVYLQHWSMFVAGLHILSSDSMCNNDLHTADTLLQEFYKQFSRLYSEYKTTVYCVSIKENIFKSQQKYCGSYYTGEEGCSMNVHLLSHLTECVKSWGPVWCYSCFPFESRNADIKWIFHGSRDMSNHICKENGFSLLLLCS